MFFVYGPDTEIMLSTGEGIQKGFNRKKSTSLYAETSWSSSIDRRFSGHFLVKKKSFFEKKTPSDGLLCLKSFRRPSLHRSRLEDL